MRYEVAWRAFGVIEVDAETEDEAVSMAQVDINDFLELDWDGLDVEIV